LQIDFDVKELAILEHALYVYNKFVEKAEANFLEIEKERIARDNCGCCVSGNCVPDEPPYYKNSAFCNALREKIKKAQMQLPLGEQPDRYGISKYVNLIDFEGKVRKK
jgi:hypothetical protein